MLIVVIFISITYKVQHCKFERISKEYVRIQIGADVGTHFNEPNNKL